MNKTSTGLVKLVPSCNYCSIYGALKQSRGPRI